MVNFGGLDVLITGGTGSFGQYMTRTLLSLSHPPRTIRIFSRDEEKQLDMQRQYGDSVEFVIGDVRDYPRVYEAMHTIDIVYHAAALKIIPTAETNVAEALKTNILGTVNVKHACTKANVHNCILISTDKAVKPINLYGMTKAVAEKVWLSSPVHTVVRYGNVLGSRGSILPFFKSLIKDKKPVPITDTRMTRFLLTLKEAVDLVLYATFDRETSMRDVGKIWVPKIKAHKVTDLVTALAGQDYPMRTVGIRAGEKLHECLVNEFEMTKTTEMTGNYQIRPYEKENYHVLTSEFTSETAPQLSVSELRKILEVYQ